MMKEVDEREVHTLEHFDKSKPNASIFHTRKMPSIYLLFSHVRSHDTFSSLDYPVLLLCVAERGN